MLFPFFFFFLSPVKQAEYLGLNEMNKPGEKECPLRCRAGECRLMLFAQTVETGTLNKASLITVARRSSLDHQRCSTADVSQTWTGPEGSREPRCARGPDSAPHPPCPGTTPPPPRLTRFGAAAASGSKLCRNAEEAGRSRLPEDSRHITDQRVCLLDTDRCRV